MKTLIIDTHGDQSLIDYIFGKIISFIPDAKEKNFGEDKNRYCSFGFNGSLDFEPYCYNADYTNLEDFKNNYRSLEAYDSYSELGQFLKSVEIRAKEQNAKIKLGEYEGKILPNGGVEIGCAFFQAAEIQKFIKQYNSFKF